MKWFLMLITMLALSSCASSGNWEKMDTNGDGQVSKAEFTDHGDSKFSKVDKDGNGVIDAAEMPKCKKKKNCKKKKDCKEKSKCKSKNKGHKQTDCKDGQYQLHSKDKRV
jgi:major membrane immunogen (membrane-anchored lipoprotein)